MTNWQAWMACGLLMSLPAAAQADIFRWDNGQLIPGTHAITPGPALQLGARVLQFAELSNTNLTGSSFYDRMLGGSDLTGARFTNANLSYAVLTGSNLSGADLAGATVIGTYLYGTQFTKEQIYTTASYQGKDLHEIQFGRINLTGWDFNGQDLTGAEFGSSTLTNADLAGSNLTDAGLSRATLTNANFAGAVVAGANFFRGYDVEGSGITLPQLYSTASYQQRNLRGIKLFLNDLTGGDFSGQDLTGADLGGSNLANANLSGTNLTNARLSGGCGFGCVGAADLTNADLSGAVVAGADFSFFNNEFSGFRGSGITLPQLYSTASYQQRNLRGIGLRIHHLTGWDFSGQDLSGASLEGSTLTSANFAGAVVTGADFSIFAYSFGYASIAYLGSGITLPQLYSTASYQQRNLRGIGLSYCDLSGWDFSGQDLAGADFFGSQLTNANFSFADLRGAQMEESGPIQLARNTIREFGAINGLDLGADAIPRWLPAGGDDVGLDCQRTTDAAEPRRLSHRSPAFLVLIGSLAFASRCRRTHVRLRR